MELKGGMERNKIYIMSGGTPITGLREDNCFHRINKDTEALCGRVIMCMYNHIKRKLRNLV